MEISILTNSVGGYSRARASGSNFRTTPPLDPNPYARRERSGLDSSDDTAEISPEAKALSAKYTSPVTSDPLDINIPDPDDGGSESLKTSTDTEATIAALLGQ